MMFTPRSKRSPTIDGAARPRRAFSRLGGALGYGLLAAGLVPADALAATNPESYGDGLVALSNDELRAMRGGMTVNGVDFDFGAIVRVLVGNDLVAETHLMMSGDGSMNRSTTIHNPTLATLFEGSHQLEGTNIQFGGPEGSIGVIISDSNGISIALNNINLGNIFGLLANGAVGREISQTISATLTINNFSQINSALQSDIAAGQAMSAGMPDVMLSP